jgi:polysaccharide biosynthesis transport protein
MTALSLPTRYAGGTASASDQDLIPVDPAGTAPLRLDDMAGLLRAISRACPDRSSRIIQVISSVHCEGVSSVARALAYTATVIDGAAALVCDATTNQQTLRQFGDKNDRPSLCDMIDAPGNLEATISPVRGLNYAVCMLTRPSRNSHPAIKAGRLGMVLDMLREMFDWIIIDSIPASDGSFGPAISQLCDGSVVVAQAGNTRLRELSRTTQTLDLYGGRVLGMVLNKVDPERTRRSTRRR